MMYIDESKFLNLELGHNTNHNLYRNKQRLIFWNCILFAVQVLLQCCDAVEVRGRSYDTRTRRVNAKALTTCICILCT
jgi:hypothetical protein